MDTKLFEKKEVQLLHITTSEWASCRAGGQGGGR